MPMCANAGYMHAPNETLPKTWLFIWKSIHKFASAALVWCVCAHAYAYCVSECIQLPLLLHHWFCRHAMHTHTPQLSPPVRWIDTGFKTSDTCKYCTGSAFGAYQVQNMKQPPFECTMIFAFQSLAFSCWTHVLCDVQSIWRLPDLKFSSTNH